MLLKIANSSIEIKNENRSNESNYWSERLQPFILSSCYHEHKRWETLSFDKVYSRAIIWNEKGQGSLKVNGDEFELKTNQFVILPFEHSIEFKPDQLNPFVTGCIYFSSNSYHPKLIDKNLSFKEMNQQFQFPTLNHQDAHLPDLDEVIKGSFVETSILKKLCEYIQLSFKRGWDLQESKTQAKLFLNELKIYIENSVGATSFLPLQLKKMIKYIQENFIRPIQIEELSKVGHCSRTTVFRLFENYLSQTPIMYTSQLKVEKAKDLLLSSTTSVSQISKELGFSDAFYFSKFFKKHVGVSPSKFRK